MSYETQPRPTETVWPIATSADSLSAQLETFLHRSKYVLGHTPSTQQWYVTGVRSFLRFAEATNLAWPITITTDLLETWLGWMRERRLSGVTLKTYWKAFEMVVRAIAEQAGASNPFEKAHTPKLPQHNYKALTPPECEQLLATVRNYPWQSDFERVRNTAIIAIALYAGLRKREILRLEVEEVDLQDGTIQIRKGKGRNGGKDRTAYIPAELTEILSAYVHLRRLHHITAPAFFVSARNRGIGPQVLREVVERVRSASGISFSLHVLRHSFVTMLLRQGVPLHIARDLAGHASIQSTEGYARVFREDLKQHIQAVRFTT
jgi:site-specific recombinase XerD